MAAKGYTTAAAVAAYMGLTLTAGQTTQANVLIEDAESFWDGETGRPWMTGVITDEPRRVFGNQILTHCYPVATVEAVSVRPGPFDAWTALAASTGFVLDNPGAGIIALASVYSGHRAKVSYTPDTATVPAEIALAINMIVAHWLSASLSPETQNVESYSIGQDLSVKYRSSSGWSIPSKAADILERYKERSVG